MSRYFATRDLVTGVPIALGALAMISESMALENTRDGLTLFWMAFAPAACLGGLLGYLRNRRDPKAERATLERRTEPLILAIGFGFVFAAAASLINRVGVGEPRRASEVAVIDKWKQRTGYMLLVDWAGAQEELKAPIDVWEDAQAGTGHVQLVVFAGRLGFEVAERIGTD